MSVLNKITVGSTEYDIEDATAAKASSLGTAAAKDSTNAVTANSTDLVESGAVKTELDKKADGKTVEITLTENTNPSKFVQKLINIYNTNFPNGDINSIGISNPNNYNFSSSNSVVINFQYILIKAYGLKLNQEFPSTSWGGFFGELLGFDNSGNVIKYQIDCKWGDAFDSNDPSLAVINLAAINTVRRAPVSVLVSNEEWYDNSIINGDNSVNINLYIFVDGLTLAANTTIATINTGNINFGVDGGVIIRLPDGSVDFCNVNVSNGVLSLKSPKALNNATGNILIFGNILNAFF